MDRCLSLNLLEFPSAGFALNFRGIKQRLRECLGVVLGGNGSRFIRKGSIASIAGPC